MKVSIQTAVHLAALLSAAQPCLASSKHGHHHVGRRHHHSHTAGNATSTEEDIIGAKQAELKARGIDTCSFPTGNGLVAITPNGDNAGWAQSPDQPCTCGSYCPYACPPGQVSAQWKDGSTYATTDRMAGGLFCGLDGKAVKPFDSKPYCKDGTGTVAAVNKVGDVVSFCQTVLPGNEDILIPNDVYDTLILAVPDTTYWQATASHFYINPPGTNSDKGCHWGTSAEAWGNWAPFVAGANTDASGLTFVKVGINPIWQSSDLYATKPSFGLKIECTSGDCVGLPCAVDGSGVTSDLKATGAGGSDFCVVTVPKGGQANVVVYNLDGSSGSTSSAAPTSTSKAQPTTTSTTSVRPTTTSTTSTSSSTSSTSSTPSSTSPSSSSSKPPSHTSSSIPQSSSTKPAKTSSSASSYDLGGIFQENGTSTATSFSWTAPASTATGLSGGNPASGGSSSGSASATESAKSESSAAQGNGAIAGLIVAIIAAACIL